MITDIDLQTAELVKSLPDDRASTLLTHRESRRAWLRQVILEARGAELASQITILVVTRRGELIKALSGRRGPIWIDAAWYSVVPPDVAIMAGRMIETANAEPTPERMGRTTRHAE